MPELREHATVLLSGQLRDRFLAALAASLALAARGEYLEAGRSETQALGVLRAVNEMLIVVGKQLRSSLAGRREYPDDAFMRVLAENSKTGHVEHVLQWALKEARRLLISDTDA
jgi:hypothetical protein